MLTYTAGVTTTRVMHVTGAARAVVLLSRTEQCCYRTLHLMNKDTVLA